MHKSHQYKCGECMQKDIDDVKRNRILAGGPVLDSECGECKRAIQSGICCIDLSCPIMRGPYVVEHVKRPEKHIVLDDQHIIKRKIGNEGRNINKDGQ